MALIQTKMNKRGMDYVEVDFNVMKNNASGKVGVWFYQPSGKRIWVYLSHDEAKELSRLLNLFTTDKV